MSLHRPSVHISSDDESRALSLWTFQRLGKLRGLGMKAIGSKQGVLWGYNGKWRVKTILGAFVTLFMVEVGLILAGSGGLPLWALLAMGPSTIAIGKRLRVVRGIWKQTRSDSHGLFHDVCTGTKAAARDLIHSALPNPLTLPIMIAGLVSMASLWVHKKLSASGSTRFISRTVGIIIGSIDSIISKAFIFIFEEGYVRLERQRSRQRVIAAHHRDPEEAGLDSYWHMAMAYHKHLLMIDRYGSLMTHEDMEELIGDESCKLRDHWLPLLKEVDSDPEHLTHQLDIMDAAHVAPWWRPRADLPTIAELALRLHSWQLAKHQTDEALEIRLESLVAHIEMHDIATGLDAPKVSQTRVSLRL